MPTPKNHPLLRNDSPKSGAQRQAEYRRVRPYADDGNGQRRLNTWISTAASLALARLAQHHGTTRRGVLEQLIVETDAKILSALDPDSPQWDQYMIVTQ